MINKKEITRIKVMTPKMRDEAIAILKQPENKEKVMRFHSEMEAASAKLAAYKSHPAYDLEKELAGSLSMVLGGVYKGVVKFITEYSGFMEIELCDGAFCAVLAEDSNYYKSLKEGDECLVKIIRLPVPSKKENAVGSFAHINGDEPVLVAEPSQEWLDYKALFEMSVH